MTGKVHIANKFTDPKESLHLYCNQLSLQNITLNLFCEEGSFISCFFFCARSDNITIICQTEIILIIINKIILFNRNIFLKKVQKRVSENHINSLFNYWYVRSASNMVPF